MTVTVVSIETVGFGDFRPVGTRSQIFAIFYNTFGILNLGIAISTCRETVIESFEHSYRKKLQHMSDRRNAKREKKIRKNSIKRALVRAGLPVYVYAPEQNDIHEKEPRRGYGVNNKQPKLVLNESALPQEELQAALAEVEQILQLLRQAPSSLGVKVFTPGTTAIQHAKDELFAYSGTRRLLDTFGQEETGASIRLEQRREFMIKVCLM